MMKWFKAVLILPVSVLIVIPLIILLLSRYKIEFTNSPVLIIVAAGLALFGLFLAGWTMFLFQRKGKGTAAPWSPPKKLVISGPYKYVRNPMLSSVFIMLAAEFIVLNSIALFIWMCVFIALNAIYMPLIEEKDLEKRFGKDYKLYKENVPRWIPRPTPWELPE